MLSRPIPSLVMAMALVGLGACKSKSADGEAGAQDAPAGSSAGNGGGNPTPSGEGELDDPRALALPIPKATAPATIKAKGSKQLPSLGKIQHLYALTATAKQPEWGNPGQGEAKRARDDDLDTAWTCEFGGATPCVLGLALPEPAKVEIIRLYGAAGPRFRDYTGHPRLAKLRVHTDAGFVEVSLPDGANHAYVLFAAPVPTQTLAFEVLGVHGGKDALVHFAEVEVYGTDGAPRTPIVLDPAQAFVSWETSAWDGGKDGRHTIRQAFVEFLRPDGAEPSDPALAPASRRFTRASAVYGREDDDYLLFERMFSTSCEETEGSYLLFDRRNRMFYPLTDLGGVGAPVYRHREGRGFAVGWIDGSRFTVKGVVEQAGELKWKRPPKELPEDPLALLSEWGFETTPLARGQGPTDLPAGCKIADVKGIDRMLAAAKLPLGGEIDPNQWVSCSVGTDTLFVSAPCNAHAQAYAIAADDALVGKFSSKQADARGLRLRRTGLGEALLLELSNQAGAGSILYWVDQGSFAQLEKAGGLAVRPPSSCVVCSDEWGSAEVVEDGTDEGVAPELLDGGLGEDEAAEDADAFLLDEGGDENAEPEVPDAPLPPTPPLPPPPG